MKKIQKTAAAIFIGIVMLFSMSAVVSASAAGTISIKVGEDILDIAPILIHNDRTFAPYDVLFDALDVSAECDAQTGTITATRDNTTIILTMDSNKIGATIAGVTQWIYSDTTPIYEQENDRIYVPIRFTAQALGYVVGWDGATQTVELKTLDALIDESGVTYTAMDRVLGYAREASSVCHAVDGSFNATIDTAAAALYGSTSDITIPLTISGTASGLIDSFGNDMSLHFQTNLSDLVSQMQTIMGEELDEETAAIIEQLDDVDISLISSSENGMLYIQSPLLEALADVPEDAWVSIDAGDVSLYSGLDQQFTDVLNTDTQSDTQGDFRQYVKMVLQSELLWDYGGETMDVLSEINAVFSDQAMTRDGDDYIITINQSFDQDWYEQTSSLEVHLLFDGEDFSGITIDLLDSETYSYTEESSSESSTALSFSFMTDGQADLTVTATLDGEALINLNCAMTYTQTDEQPARAPVEGSTIISIEDISID